MFYTVASKTSVTVAHDGCDHLTVTKEYVTFEDEALARDYGLLLALGGIKSRIESREARFGPVIKTEIIDTVTE